MDTGTSANTTLTTEEVNGESYYNPVQVSLAVVCYCLGLFILCSNVVVMRLVAVTAALQTRANTYIVSLAATDALVGLLLCVFATGYVPPITPWFDSNEAVCVGTYCLSYIAGICSALNMCLIAVDRFTYIHHPLWYERVVTERAVKTSIVCVWVASVLIGSSPLAFHTFDSASACTLSEVVPDSFSCNFVGSFFFACCSLIFVLYVKMAWTSFQTMRAISKTRCVFVQTIETSSRKPRLKRGTFKAIKLFVAVFGVLLVCWSPYFILEIADKVTTINKTILSCSMILGFLNSGMNAFIYPYFNTDFRTAMKRMLCCDKRTVCRCRRCKRYSVSVTDATIDN